MKRENKKKCEEINTKSFGKKIQNAREKIGITQAELAEELNLSTNFLGDIERGNKLPSIKNLIKISNILKISLDTLFSDSLDNMIEEPDEIYYTDRQLMVMRHVIKNITENFS